MNPNVHSMNSAAVAASSFPTRPPRQTTGEAFPYRSLVRSPVARLIAFDDGSNTEGETWRLRDSRTSVGRSACNITIANDPDLSACHAEIIRSEQNGGHRWQLADRNSTNGTFIRIQRHTLRNGRILLIGGSRFEFVLPDVIPQSRTDDDNPLATHRQLAPLSADVFHTAPGLIELAAQGPGRIFELAEAGILLGRDPTRCRICLDNPFVDAVHAEFFQDEQYRWVIRDRGSVNGVWLRVSGIPLDCGTEFMLGGQRFRFELL